MRTSTICLTCLAAVSAQEIPVTTSMRAIIPAHTLEGVTMQPVTDAGSVRPLSTAAPQTFPALTVDGPMTVISGETLCTQSATVYLFDDKGRDEMPVNGYGTIARNGVTILGGKLMLGSASESAYASPLATASPRPFANATYTNATSVDPRVNPVQTGMGGTSAAQSQKGAAARDCAGFGILALLALGAGAFVGL